MPIGEQVSNLPHIARFDNFGGPSLFLYGFASCLLLPCYRSLVVGARPGVGPEVLNGFKAVRSMG
jgi:hypothetical protein